jgi:hypothetical protein
MRQFILETCLFAILALLVVIAYQNFRRFHQPLTTTEYQAVMLTNGNVFYGRIDHLGSDYPVLRDVFRVRQDVRSATPRPGYMLVRRKDDITGADHMIIPASAIAYIEPVAGDSTVGRLIGQASASR